MRTYRAGQIITIYQNPLSEEVPEGRARLLECEFKPRPENDTGYGGELWLVRFLKTGEVKRRWIYRHTYKSFREAKHGNRGRNGKAQAHGL